MEVLYTRLRRPQAAAHADSLGRHDRVFQLKTEFRTRQAVEESLPVFKRYVGQLLGISITDPNRGVVFASDALAAIHSYAADQISWSAFVSRADALLAQVPRS